jgi:hypothetical protein
MRRKLIPGRQSPTFSCNQIPCAGGRVCLTSTNCACHPCLLCVHVSVALCHTLGTPYEPAQRTVAVKFLVLSASVRSVLWIEERKRRTPAAPPKASQPCTACSEGCHRLFRLFGPGSGEGGCAALSVPVALASCPSCACKVQWAADKGGSPSCVSSRPSGNI